MRKLGILGFPYISEPHVWHPSHCFLALGLGKDVGWCGTGQSFAFQIDFSCLGLMISNPQVLLGKVARVQVGHKVSMKYGILLVDDRIVVEPTELSAVAMTRAPIVALQGVLLAPDAVQACSNVRLSLAASTGFARRHLEP